MVCGARMSFRFVATLTLFLALAIPAPSSSGTITFASDPSWAVSALQPDGSEGGPLGAAACYGHPNPGGFGSACPIWLPGFNGNTPADLVGGYFSKSFVVPGAPINGTVFVAVDDFVEIRVNGIVVGSKGSVTNLAAAQQAQAAGTSFDLTPYLQSGDNSLVFRAQNGPGWFPAGGCSPCGFAVNPAGLIFSGSITYEAPTPVAARSWGSLKTHYR